MMAQRYTLWLTLALAAGIAGCDDDPGADPPIADGGGGGSGGEGGGMEPEPDA
jgi:hypothetical protein